MSEDLIRRSDAIKALDANFTIKGKENTQTVLNYLELVRTRIEGAPTIEPKRGEWAKRTRDTLIAQVNFAYCSECGQPIMHEHTRPLWNFCPNCGMCDDKGVIMSGIKGINAGTANWNYKHGETKTRLFKIWSSMHERCERPKHSHYKDYGGRGIKVCEEWSEYIAFAEWARANGYTDNLTIDRIDNNGNYEPSNCRWVTEKEQHNNKRSNRIIEYQGVKYTLTQLADLAGINKTTLKERLNNGWSVKDAVEKPIRKRTRGWRMSADMRKGADDE